MQFLMCFLEKPRVYAKGKNSIKEIFKLEFYGYMKEKIANDPATITKMCGKCCDSLKDTVNFSPHREQLKLCPNCNFYIIPTIIPFAIGPSSHTYLLLDLILVFAKKKKNTHQKLHYVYLA